MLNHECNYLLILMTVTYSSYEIEESARCITHRKVLETLFHPLFGSYMK